VGVEDEGGAGDVGDAADEGGVVALEGVADVGAWGKIYPNMVVSVVATGSDELAPALAALACGKIYA